MIQRLQNKALENLFRENFNKGVPANLENKIRIRLEVIDSGLIVEDIRLPDYDLHELKGDRKGTWSIKVCLLVLSLFISSFCSFKQFSI